MLALSKPMGKKGGRTEGSFITETRRQTTEFYRDLVQGLIPAQAKAPKIREDEQKTTEPDQDLAPESAVDGVVLRERDPSVSSLEELPSFLAG
jgi:hypothetical protein